MALTSARADQLPDADSTSSRPPPPSRTAVTSTGRRTGSRNRSSYAAKYSPITSDEGRSGSAPTSSIPGSACMPCTLP